MVDTQLVVAHLDHTTQKGGAEIGLSRVLASNGDWRASLLLAGRPGSSLGAFESLDSRSMTVEWVGSAQKPGASKSGWLDSLGFAFNMILQAMHVRNSTSFRNADVIHANTSRSALYGTLACLFSRKPIVVHLRDMVTKDSLGWIGFLLFSRVVLWRCNSVIANSETTLQSAERFLSKKAGRHVIHSAIGIVRDENLTLQPSVTRIGMLARIDRWKGHKLLIRAFSDVFSGTGVELHLAGGAPFGNEMYLEELKNLADEIGVAEQVHFCGHVGDFQSFIKSMDVCVQSSLRPEPLGQNVLQYLALGRPVIAANAGGPAEWISNGVNGLLFDIGNQRSLAEALERVAGEGELRELLSVNARSTPGILSDSEVSRLHSIVFLSAWKESKR